MAKLTSLELRGWKSIEHARIEVGNLNVLIGPNGGGKSNLIGFFDFLRLLARGQLEASMLSGWRQNVPAMTLNRNALTIQTAAAGSVKKYL